MIKYLLIAVIACVATVALGSGFVYAQTASPSPTMTASPSPSATVMPSAAPATGFGTL